MLKCWRRREPNRGAWKCGFPYHDCGPELTDHPHTDSAGPVPLTSMATRCQTKFWAVFDESLHCLSNNRFPTVSVARTSLVLRTMAPYPPTNPRLNHSLIHLATHSRIIHTSTIHTTHSFCIINLPIHLCMQYPFAIPPSVHHLPWMYDPTTHAYMHALYTDLSIHPCICASIHTSGI